MPWWQVVQLIFGLSPVDALALASGTPAFSGSMIGVVQVARHADAVPGGHPRRASWSDQFAEGAGVVAVGAVDAERLR